jgi:hypothetical protein
MATSPDITVAIQNCYFTLLAIIPVWGDIPKLSIRHPIQQIQVVVATKDRLVLG